MDFFLFLNLSSQKKNSSFSLVWVGQNTEMDELNINFKYISEQYIVRFD